MDIQKLNREIHRLLNESEEAIPLQQRWEEEMIALPIIGTAEGEIYLQPSEDGKYIEYGSMTNGGLIVEGRIEYEPEESLDYHIQSLADEIFERFGYRDIDESHQKNESLDEELENLLKEQIVILGSIAYVKDQLRKSGFSEPDFKFEPYYGKNRKHDGVKVTALEDNIASLAIWLDDNNYKYYDIHDLEESLNEAEEDSSDDFKLTDLKYKITYNSGKSYEKNISIVDTMNYKLYDLGTEQMADIVLKNLEDNGFKLGSNDSSHLDYDAETGIIKNTRPIAITDDIGEQKGTLSFEVILWTPLWTHPERIERR